MPANELLAAWLDLRRDKSPSFHLSAKDRAKQGTAAARICAGYPRDSILRAWVGMMALFPYAEPPVGRSQAWDLWRFEQRFAEALAQADQHPAVNEERERRKARELILNRNGGHPPYEREM